MPVRIEDLERAKDLLHMSELSRRSGLKKQTLFSQLRRGTDLSPKDAKRITDALLDAGIILLPESLMAFKGKLVVICADDLNPEDLPSGYKP